MNEIQEKEMRRRHKRWAKKYPDAPWPYAPTGALATGNDRALLLEHLDHMRSCLDELDIQMFKLSVRAAAVAQNATIATIGDLRKWTAWELLEVKYCGRKTYQEFSALLSSLGLPPLREEASQEKDEAEIAWSELHLPRGK